MINFDGEFFSDDAVYLNAKNSVFAHGDGLLEVIRVVNGTFFFWEDHYLRLMASMRVLRMEIPMSFTLEFLKEEIAKTIRESGLTHQAVLARVYVFPKYIKGLENAERLVSYLIEVEEGSSPFYLHQDQPYEADLYKDFYIQPGMLSTLPLVNSVLKNVGRVYALENGYEDCILLNDQKNVVQTLQGNLFLVAEDRIKTPPLSDGCENSVLRKKVMELIRKSNEFTLEEASISPFELQKADELFISDIAIGIRSVTRYRRTDYKTVVAKNILGKLNALARLN
ncbi:branched-chain amino acid aminotransferase [Muriicola jejuensis]|uniref:branched-chain-amino-acid transaminase n=1 Tax=Muriicola jejuensis TaxID=504488 RepID=A0A6P0UE50_9FLAO|nr:aminotransferase class IV [Muriicola jejuensis]NER11495.1 aminotransferase class IV [Muriicola jejuensis]SMP20319.1 branched-chain amino acid aminotransferase [Muriicola jejuensis]